MTAQNRTTLKAYFVTGATPTQAQFGDLIDSFPLPSEAQTPSANLSALSGLTISADTLPYGNGSGTMATATFTSAARALLDDASAGAMLTTLGVSAFIQTLLDDATAATALATLGAAPVASPTFTGTPAAPTATAGTNTTQLATTAFVQAAVAALVASSPAALDTLNELAAALGNDANFSATMTSALAAKAPLASPTLTGTPGAPTAAAGTNTTQIATTAFVQAALALLSTPVTLTDGATITPDLATGRVFSVTLAGNRTLANPSNQVAGQSGRILVKQDATGSRTLGYGTAWKFAGGTPTLSTAANAVDMIVYDVQASGEIYATLAKGFA